ncbi:MAG: gliding motility-associated protein GldE [Bacteroidota bacterium]
MLSIHGLILVLSSSFTLGFLQTASSLPFYAINIGILILLLILNAIISGSEVAFFSLTSEERARCRESEISSERTIIKLLDNPQRLLATLLIFINLVNITFIVLASYLTWQSFPKDSTITIVILTFGVTFVIVFFGELIPKVYANQNNLRFAKLTVPIVEFAHFIFKPFATMLLAIPKLFENSIERKGYNITAEELNHALEITTGKDTTEKEKDILKGVVNFGNTSSRQIMRSRLDISAFDLDWDFHELMDKINKSGYSRVPVYKDKIDKIEGILYIKDLLPHIDKDETFEWQPLIRTPFFIPENKKIDDLLYDFQEKRVHMAIVVNEYGETEGLVTMEDIIEEIVGDIHDEYDVEAVEFKKIDDNTYEFEAKTALNDFSKILNIDLDTLDKVRGESESLAGLLLELFGRLPNASEEIEHEQFKFNIISADNKRIKRVKVMIKREEIKAE